MVNNKVIVNLGAGRQSSYLAVLLAEEDPILIKYWFDGFEIIMSNTHDESEETYNFLYDQLIPYLRKFDIDVTILDRKMTHGTENMYEDYWNNRGIPTRKFRSCTDKFKIQVIRKYLRDRYDKKTTTYSMLLGITIEEAERRMRKSDVKYATNVYPFVYDIPITAIECTEELNKRGLYPVKSGCYYCPFEKLSRFTEYVKDKPEAKARVLALENRALDNNPKLHIFKKPLRVIFDVIDNQTTLDDWDNDGCDSGYCFT